MEGELKLKGGIWRRKVAFSLKQRQKGANNSVQRPSAEEAEVTPGARTRLKCNESQRPLSWSKTIEGTAHGGRTTLEELKNNPRMMDEIHVVFFPMA